jgi:hypothetical protein
MVKAEQASVRALESSSHSASAITPRKTVRYACRCRESLWAISCSLPDVLYCFYGTSVQSLCFPVTPQNRPVSPRRPKLLNYRKAFRIEGRQPGASLSGARREGAPKARGSGAGISSAGREAGGTIAVHRRQGGTDLRSSTDRSPARITPKRASSHASGASPCQDRI